MRGYKGLLYVIYGVVILLNIYWLEGSYEWVNIFHVLVGAMVQYIFFEACHGALTTVYRNSRILDGTWEGD